MRIVVTGAGGGLGRALVASWAAAGTVAEGDEVIGLAKDDLDIADAVEVMARVGSLAPDLVINAAAYTAVDAAEEHLERAHEVNTVGPGNLALACRDAGAALVHISTDYVHGGAVPTTADGAPRGWRVTDPIAPATVYGRSKADGEALVRASLDDHWIVRTAWLHSVDGGSFVRSILNRARAGGPLRVVDDQRGCPTFSVDLVAALREMVRVAPHGTWNRAGAGACTWHDLASAAVEMDGLDIEVERIAASELGLAAARPAWSVLSDELETAAGLTPLPSWRDGLRRFVDALD